MNMIQTRRCAAQFLNRSCVQPLVATAMALLMAVGATAQTSQPAPVGLASGATAEYRLGSGDAIKISVFQNPDMTLETRVSEAGTISFPLLGTVRIGGLSVSDAEARIAEGLRKGNFVKQPQVSILVIKVTGNQASVLGAVNQPGRYPLEVADTRLTDLLANARGVAPSGGDLLVISGTRGGKAYRAEIDLPTLFSANGREQDILIQNGDVLWVDRFPTIYIYGEVQKPGQIRLERGMTLLQGLAAGGGLTLRGTERGIRVHRKGGDGKVQEIKPAMDEALKDGDVIYVRESLF
ncbi:polysaccharide export outer membrane protein [Roseateles sp. YR242]|uniref:polysaccharide export protein EpsE n=1 Tax=Roseateles sp. YR242 TaxID=1855305 RepID=UPI0008BB577E|nr:polysaccharide export protein EpsE [Roseateles sp. YR242]SEK52898.1 polysaccharide export outer membrane protein [Roseateles sp. YR242]